jgi:hypothetical protein
MQLRRSVPRQPVDWSGTYRFSDDPEGSSRECRISDISTAGAGVELLDTTPEEANDRRIFLTVELSGDVRNSLSLDNSVRVGIEFPDVSGDAENYIMSVKRFGNRW